MFFIFSFVRVSSALFPFTRTSGIQFLASIFTVLVYSLQGKGEGVEERNK